MDDSEVFKRIGSNIRVARTIKRLTQAQLAELIDVHEKYIGKIEAGKQNLTVKTLNKIASALDMDITRFFSGYNDLMLSK